MGNLRCFRRPAIAADVTLYGIVDLGVNYTHVDMDGQGDDLDNFDMKSGQQSGSHYDNSIVYRTPSFAGFQVTAMYSMGQSTDGKGMIGVGYLDASQSDFQEDYSGSDFDFTRWVVSVGYDYPLSKRTTVYGVMSYMDDDYDDNAAANSGVNPSAYTFMIDMRHKF